MPIRNSFPDQLKSDINLLLKYKDNRRKQDQIIADIVNILQDTKKEVFIPFVLQIMTMIDWKKPSEINDGLMSPLKQYAYIIDIYLSLNHSPDKDMPSEVSWNLMKELLMEAEMTYFGDIGFPDEDPTEAELNKISVSMKSFFDFYSNAQLSYDEQTLGRLQTNFSKFDSEIVNEFGFSTADIIKFCLHTRELINNKSNRFFKSAMPKNRERLARQLKSGAISREEWLKLPEIMSIAETVSRPGSWFIYPKESIVHPELNNSTINNLLSFLKYDEAGVKGKKIYYADQRQFFLTPVVELENGELLIPPFKFLLESFYNRINQWLSETRKEKYTKLKNQAVEKKTVDIFKKFFKEEAHYFQHFYFDKENRAEQDLLVIYKGNALIIEIKDIKFRAPMRDPIRGYDKIKSDFRIGVQKAYNQCKRLENKFTEANNFKIFDEKTNRQLYEIDTSKIKNYYSIIVTQHKYGSIQTNLSELLEKEESDLYPWSVCVDDLEIFLLGLKKIKRSSATTNFLNFLDQREYLHERVICSDELELCGFFINQQHQFRKYAVEMDDILVTDIRMSNVFDAHYQNGLGFTNEIDIVKKKKNPVGNYNKFFSVLPIYK